MPEYRRAIIPGGTFFFTVVSYHRHPLWKNARTVELLRAAVRGVQRERPFEFDAGVVLPNHLHFIWTLPPGDDNFSTRWGLIKSRFTSQYLRAGGREIPISASRKSRGERGVWQRRFWEHTIRDERDFELHVDYIHYNPVKHGLAACPHAWPYSSFAKWVKMGIYAADWQCHCGSRTSERPDFGDLEERIGEP